MARTTKSKTSQPLTTAQRLSSIVKSCRDIMRKDKGLNGDLDRLPMLTWIMFLKFLDDLEQIAEQEAQMAGKRFRPAIESPYRWRDWAAKPAGITGDELIVFVNNEEAFSTARRLAREEGILGGISTGAACAAALKIAVRDEMQGKLVVFIAPSTSERYISTDLFSDL